MLALGQVLWDCNEDSPTGYLFAALTRAPCYFEADACLSFPHASPSQLPLAAGLELGTAAEMGLIKPATDLLDGQTCMQLLLTPRAAERAHTWSQVHELPCDRYSLPRYLVVSVCRCPKACESRELPGIVCFFFFFQSPSASSAIKPHTTQVDSSTSKPTISRHWHCPMAPGRGNPSAESLRGMWGDSGMDALPAAGSSGWIGTYLPSYCHCPLGWSGTRTFLRDGQIDGSSLQ